MRMPECQDELISEITKIQENVVVVMHNGSPVEMPWPIMLGDFGSLFRWGGSRASCSETAVWHRNPCGKLAETIPYQLSDNPSYLYFLETEKKWKYREGVFVGYRYYDTKNMSVRFPFGHGLSYTKYEYSDLQISKDSIKDNEKLQVAFKVKNVGDRAGKEVIQLYVADKTYSAERRKKS